VSVATLLEHFLSEAGQASRRPRAGGPGDDASARVALDTLLAMRGPGPPPEEVAAELDALLEREVAARAVRVAGALPPLSRTHGVPGALGRRVALRRAI
jgi:hypothetical protein